MAHHKDHDRISRKAHELWENEGRPHGRAEAHWDAAKEIVALEDSMGATLKPRLSGAAEPSEPKLAIDNQGDMPNLTDQGRDGLTDTDREPAITKPARAKPAAAKPGAKQAAAAPVPASASAGKGSVTGKGMPKPAARPEPVTKGKSDAKR